MNFTGWSVTTTLAWIGGIVVAWILLATAGFIVQEQYWQGEQRLEAAVHQEVQKQLEGKPNITLRFYPWTELEQLPLEEGL